MSPQKKARVSVTRCDTEDANVDKSDTDHSFLENSNVNDFTDKVKGVVNTNDEDVDMDKDFPENNYGKSCGDGPDTDNAVNDDTDINMFSDDSEVEDTTDQPFETETYNSAVKLIDEGAVSDIYDDDVKEVDDWFGFLQ